MKRAVLALLATVAGLVFIFTFKPMPMTVDLPPTVFAAPDKGGLDKGGLDRGGPDKGGLDKLLAAKGSLAEPAAIDPFSLAGLPDGDHTGDVVEIPGGHGPLQVRLSMSGGRVVDVQAAHEPTSPNSELISGQALPVLRDAVLTVQQGPVDVVSGATAVSQAFNESLLSIME
jgi:uncharacterized protein with FMN-binding domain